MTETLEPYRSTQVPQAFHSFSLTKSDNRVSTFGSCGTFNIMSSSHLPRVTCCYVPQPSCVLTWATQCRPCCVWHWWLVWCTRPRRCLTTRRTKWRCCCCCCWCCLSWYPKHGGTTCRLSVREKRKHHVNQYNNPTDITTNLRNRLHSSDITPHTHQKIK